MNKSSILIAIFILSFISFSIYANAFTIQDFANSLSQIFSSNTNNATVGGFSFFPWIQNLFNSQPTTTQCCDSYGDIVPCTSPGAAPCGGITTTCPQIGECGTYPNCFKCPTQTSTPSPTPCSQLGLCGSYAPNCYACNVPSGTPTPTAQPSPPTGSCQSENYCGIYPHCYVCPTTSSSTLTAQPCTFDCCVNSIYYQYKGCPNNENCISGTCVSTNTTNTTCTPKTCQQLGYKCGGGGSDGCGGSLNCGSCEQYSQCTGNLCSCVNNQCVLGGSSQCTGVYTLDSQCNLQCPSYECHHSTVSPNCYFCGGPVCSSNSYTSPICNNLCNSGQYCKDQGIGLDGNTECYSCVTGTQTSTTLPPTSSCQATSTDIHIPGQCRDSTGLTWTDQCSDSNTLIKCSCSGNYYTTSPPHYCSSECGSGGGICSGGACICNNNQCSSGSDGYSCQTASGDKGVCQNGQCTTSPTQTVSTTSTTSSTTTTTTPISTTPPVCSPNELDSLIYCVFRCLPTNNRYLYYDCSSKQLQCGNSSTNGNNPTFDCQQLLEGVTFGTAIGAIKDNNGNTVSNARITLTSSSGVSETIQADSNGVYIIHNLPSGSYTITAVAQDYSSSSQTVSVNGQTVPVQLSLNKVFSTSASTSAQGKSYTTSLVTPSNDILWIVTGSPVQNKIFVSDSPNQVTYNTVSQGTVNVLTFIFTPTFKVYRTQIDVQ